MKTDKVIQIGNLIEESKFSNPQVGRVYSTDGISRTIDTMRGGQREPKILVYDDFNRQMAKDHNIMGTIRQTFNATAPRNGINLIEIIDMENTKLKLPKELEGKKFRIRKLTERECFRLMGVDDADIDKMQSAGLSKSAQYKLAGNSIVVDVLYHIFRKAFIETENENSQLTLF